MRRPLHAYAGIGALLTLITCSSLDNFRVTESASTTLPAASPLETMLGQMGFGSFATFDLTQNQELENQGVSKSDIDSVHLRTLTLTITAPTSGQDFDFLDSIAFYAEADGEPRVLIASGGPFTAGLTTVGLDVEDVDLKPYVAAASMSITTDVTGRRPENETTVEATMTLDVDVNVSGALCGK